MSDTMEQLKEIKGLLMSIIATAVACMAVGGVIMEWRISVNVAAALGAQNIGTDSKIIAMDAVAADNKRTGEENAEDISENKQAVRDAFKILMGPDDDDS